MFLKSDSKAVLDGRYHDRPVNVVVAGVDSTDGIGPPFLGGSNGRPQDPLAAAARIATEC